MMASAFAKPRLNAASTNCASALPLGFGPGLFFDPLGRPRFGPFARIVYTYLSENVRPAALPLATTSNADKDLGSDRMKADLFAMEREYSDTRRGASEFGGPEGHEQGLGGIVRVLRNQSAGSAYGRVRTSRMLQEDDD